MGSFVQKSITVLHDYEVIPDDNWKVPCANLRNYISRCWCFFFSEIEVKWSAKMSARFKGSNEYLIPLGPYGHTGSYIWNGHLLVIVDDSCRLCRSCNHEVVVLSLDLIGQSGLQIVRPSALHHSNTGCHSYVQDYILNFNPIFILASKYDVIVTYSLRSLGHQRWRVWTIQCDGWMNPF